MFLGDLIGRPVGGHGAWRGIGLYVGEGQLALEVVVYESQTKPNSGAMQDAWRERRAGRSAPVLIVVLHDDRATIAGPSGEDLPIQSGIDRGTAERLCRAALEEPDRHAALLFLAQAMPSLETAAPGLRNEGLFALHELTQDVPRRPEWRDHIQRSRGILAARPTGTDLLRGLGFTVERLDNMTQLLKGGDRRLALAVLLERTDAPEAGSPRFGNLSPVSYALSKADQENLDWVVVVQGDRLRLYPTGTDVGVGRRGRAETYLELQTSVLPEERLGYLTLLFSAEALQKDGSVSRLLEDSKRFAANLADRLRDRIYDEVMPLLARAVVQARNLTAPTAEQLGLTYRMALTILFRLLFVAYAEDRDLLPYRMSESYRRRSLKQKAQELAEHARDLTPPTPGSAHWDEVVRIWTAIERGDLELSVPAYNGGLFTRDSNVSRAGAELAGIQLPNELFEPALQKLLLSDVGGDGFQPVDFRSLGVREFGTIYEGLLESELSVAEQDLMLDNRGSYVPVRGAVPPVVSAGEIYLHNRSGARKASGSYFTKSFAVEHLLDHALVPALQEHLARVSQLDEADAAEAFFDLRVADIAMGSGHFLVAAIDRIEKAFTDYLAQENACGAAGVRNELSRLRQQARRQLGDIAEQMVFEDSQLLRRLIARRCIYGVDQNPLAVQLARVAVWIHTFVPGLPLSVLDHNLVRGNSLVGIGTVREVEEKFETAGTTMFPVDAQTLLAAAAQPLKRLANIADATLGDVEQARDAMERARLAVADTKALCDIITAQRIDPELQHQFENWDRDRTTIQRSETYRRAQQTLNGLDVFHFPIAFPEVFLRRRAGFDALLGNPPWEKARVEEHEFWARHFPGLRGRRSADRDQRIAELRAARPDLVRAWEQERLATEKLRDALRHIPGMATGHPDLFRAFVWRFVRLAAADGGRLGVVLPGDMFKIKGCTDLRSLLLATMQQVHVTFTTNKQEWVFDDVHEQKTIAFVAATKGAYLEAIEFTANISHAADWLRLKDRTASVSEDWLRSFSNRLVWPTVVSVDDLDVLFTFMQSPALRHHDTLRLGRIYADFETTRDRSWWKAEPDEGDWPVYGGESFDLWEPSRGPTKYYAWTSPAIFERAQEKRLRSPQSTAYGQMPTAWKLDKQTHPMMHPRIAVRNVTNRTNRRTLIAALVPPRVVLLELAPFVLLMDRDLVEEKTAFLLGVLATRVCDWWVRRFAEGHIEEEVFTSIRVPSFRGVGDALAMRCAMLAGRLAATDGRFADWAEALGLECGPLAPDVKQNMIDELDAVVARLFGLGVPQLTHIYETFHENWDYQPRLDAVLAHFHRLKQTHGCA